MCKQSERLNNRNTNAPFRKQKQWCLGTNELARRHYLQQNIYCLLTRYMDTMGRGDAPVPVAGAIPPPAASVEEDDEDEVVVTED